MEFMNGRTVDSYLWMRELVEPSYDTKEQLDPYALIFVLNGTKNSDGEYASEAEVFQAAVNGMLDVFADPEPSNRNNLMNWLDGRIRKLVKRVKPSGWEALLSEPTLHHVGSASMASVAVFTPIQVSRQPERVRKAQMSGLDISNREPSRPTVPYLKIDVDEQLHMTTGKLVAQICHGAQLFLMKSSQAEVTTWLKNGSVIQVNRVQQLPPITEKTVVIRDAGFTEIPAGSVTVTAEFISTSDKETYET